MDTVLSSPPKHLKVDFHFRTEVSVFPTLYKGRTNRKAALMTHFDAVVMTQLRTKALDAYLRACKDGGIVL